MLVPSTAYFTAPERRAIEESVKQAEGLTAAEIVPVLATRSGYYERGLFYAAIMFAFLLTVAVVGFCLLPISPAEQLTQNGFLAPLMVVFAAQVLGLVLGYQAARALPNVHRSFVPRAYMQRCVASAAQRAFADFRLTNTEAATGVLIYVSLFERMVVVLSDKAVSEKVGAGSWDEVRNILVDGLRRGEGSSGFQKAISYCGKLLRYHFPVSDNDTNELTNYLRLV